MASICRLCLNSNASHYEAIAVIEEKYFQLILPEIDIQLVQSPMFCQSCIELLQTSYSFKNTCIKTENMLKLYATNSGEVNLLLSDVLQNHFWDKNPVLSNKNNAEDPINQNIKVECDIDKFGCDLESVEKDLQIWYETEIKFYEEATNFEINQQLCESLKNICKERSDDKSKMHIDTEKLNRSLQKHLELYKSTGDIEKGNKSNLEDKKVHEHITLMVNVPEMKLFFQEHSKLESIDDAENRSDFSVDQLEIVEKKSIGSQPSKFTCDTCGKHFRWNSLLNRHKLIHSRKKIICDVCQEGFYTKAHLNQHISRSHLGIRPKRKRDRIFTCDTCGLTTFYKWTLVEHIRKHTGEKPHKCHLCDKAFAQKGSLSGHMKTVHRTERLFTCEYCSTSFKVKGSLNKHILTLHMIDKIEKKFICNYCGKKFLLRGMLNSHLKWHLADRQFSCDLCEKTFVNNASLKKHRVTHFAEKKHKCEICGKGFHQKSNIKIHMKVHGTHP